MKSLAFRLLFGCAMISNAQARVVAMKDGTFALTGLQPVLPSSQYTFLGPYPNLQEVIPKMMVILSRSPEQESSLQSLIAAQKDPSTPMYKKYLGSKEFHQRYSRASTDYAKVANYFTSRGVQVEAHWSQARLNLLNLTVAQAQNLFHVPFNQAQRLSDGTLFRVLGGNPVMDDATVAQEIASIVGLNDNRGMRRHFHTAATTNTNTSSASSFMPSSVNGPAGGYTPTALRSAYLAGVPSSATGNGQAVALIEYDSDYAPNNILQFQNYYGLSPGLNPDPAQGPQTLINKYYSALTDLQNWATTEVELDIEMIAVMAPQATVYVYNDPVFPEADVADDNLASVISESWGCFEDQCVDASYEPIFEQMAAQGQSYFAATGDSGSVYNSTEGLQYPSSVPYVTAVGGTNLQVNPSTGTWQSETGWNLSGGGVSSLWPLPLWQIGLANTQNEGSTTFRMTPDVSAVGDPDTSVSIYTWSTTSQGAFSNVGGTSVATPLGAGFVTLVNQARANNQLPRIGYLNPILYSLAQSSSAVFHDITTNIHNDYPPVTTGYDMSSGLGSMTGLPLFNALVSASARVAPPSGLVSTGAVLGNINLTWTNVPLASSYLINRGTMTGGPYTQIATSSTPSFQDTQSVPNTTYFYVVNAVNSLGTSAPSSELQVTAPPQAPTNLTLVLQ